MGQELGRKGSPFPLSFSEHPDRVLQPRAQNNPPRRASPHLEKPLVALQCFALTSHTGGRQISSRRDVWKLDLLPGSNFAVLYPGCHLPLKQRVFLQMIPLIRGPSPLESACEPQPVPSCPFSHHCPAPGAFTSFSSPYYLGIVSPPAPSPSHFSHSSQRGLSKTQIRSH